MSALVELGVVEAAAAVGTGEVSPVELVEAALERIAAVDGELGAYITVAAAEARAEARRREREARGDGSLGPLHGVPLAIKDNIETRALRTTAGSAIVDRLPARDAAAVERLRAAGAIVLGKTNLHEFAWGVTSENPHHGAVRNPWDRERIAGGSSGGSAAAVVARTAAGALGTDTGGSICLPAALCGAVGLRPTIGRVSNRGTIPLAWSLDTVGPIARSALDCAALLGAIAGPDAGDPGTAVAAVDAYAGRIEEEVAGLAVGVPAGLDAVAMQEPVREAFAGALDLLRGLGVEVVTVDALALEQIHGPWLTAMLTEASAYHAGWLRQRPDDYGDDVRTLLELGTTLHAVDYVQAQRLRAQSRSALLASLAGVDALVLPTTTITAPPLGERAVALAGGVRGDRVAELTRFACVASAAGLPALSLPCGFDGDGLPVGLQLIGAPFAEALLLRLGHAYEQGTAWHARSPLLGGAVR